MTRRTDKTGKDFENFVVHTLEEMGLNVTEQDIVGCRPTGGNHVTDVIVNERVIVSLKYQNVAGTAEEKIPYEQMCLQHACQTYGYEKALLVLAGPGWKHDKEYIDGCFSEWMNTPNVEVIDYDTLLDTVQTLR